MLAHSSSFLHIFAPQKHILVCWVVKLSSKNDINYFEIKNYGFFPFRALLYIVVVYWSLNIFCDFTNKRCGCGLVIESGITRSKKGLTNDSWRCSTLWKIIKNSIEIEKDKKNHHQLAFKLVPTENQVYYLYLYLYSVNQLLVVLHYCGLMAWGIWLIYVSVPKGPIYQSIKDTKCHVRGLWWIMKSMQNENFSCDMHQMQACDRQKFPQGCVHSILNNFHTVKPCFHKMNLIFNIRSSSTTTAAAASEWTTLHDSNQISTDCYNFLHRAHRYVVHL